MTLSFNRGDDPVCRNQQVSLSGIGNFDGPGTFNGLRVVGQSANFEYLNIVTLVE